jgi:hypothetical protein
MDNLITQVWIVVFGCSAIWLLGRVGKWKRWGYILGLIAEPAFIYSTIKHKQWGMLLVALWYVYSWSQGIYNYWFQNGKKKQ